MAGLDISTIGLLILFVSIGISSLVLNFSSKKLNFKINDFKYALITAIIASIVSPALEQLIIMLPETITNLFHSLTIFIGMQLIIILIDMSLIKFIYKEDWKNSAIAGLLWWTLNVIISIVLGLLIAIPALYGMGVFSGSQIATDTNADSCPNCPPCTNCFGDFAYINHAYDGSSLELELRNGPGDLSSLSCISPQGCSVNTSQVAFNSNFLVKIPKTSDSNQTVILSYKKASEQSVSEHTQSIDAKFFR